MVAAALAPVATEGDLAPAAMVARTMVEAMAEVRALDMADLAQDTDPGRASPPSQCISSPLLPRCMPSPRP